MQLPTFEETVEEMSRRDPRFHREAYIFLRDALDEAIADDRKQGQGGEGAHVKAPGLLKAFRRLALKEFGPMARTVLEYWGIQNSKDVGQMVYRLIEEGIFSRTEEDALEDFDGCLDFHEAFVVPFLPINKKLSENGKNMVEPYS